ncbi:MAG TPA: response regulator transcription factor [Gaiellaceae bacterium]|nr:response regulator transcription factor [Gaiellaceae bacterium]
MTPQSGEPAAAKSPRVVIAEGDAATRSGIRTALESAGMTICAEAATGDAAVALTEEHRPDIVLVSSDLDGGGIRTASTISGHASNPAVVVLATVVNEEGLVDAVRVGASGYVAKSIKPASLTAAVRAVLNGEPAIPRALVGVLMNRVRGRTSYRHVSLPQRRGVDLTSREWEVLELMRAGASTREIAERLLISEITVRRHIGSILKKLQVSSRREALRLLQSV